MLNAVTRESHPPVYSETSPAIAPPVYASQSAGDALFRCQSRPRRNTRADAISYAINGIGAALAFPTLLVSLVPGWIYEKRVMAHRRPDFLRISRHLFFCVGAVTSKERSEAEVDALIEVGALEGKKERSLRNIDAIELALESVRPDAAGHKLSEAEKSSIREAFQIFLAEASRHQNLINLRLQTSTCLTPSRSAPPACPLRCDDDLLTAIDKELKRPPSNRGSEMLSREEG